MPDAQFATIEDIIRSKNTVSPNSAQEALTSRYLRSQKKDVRGSRNLSDNFTNLPNIVQDSQQAEMARAIRGSNKNVFEQSQPLQIPKREQTRQDDIDIQKEKLNTNDSDTQSITSRFSRRIQQAKQAQQQTQKSMQGLQDLGKTASAKALRYSWLNLIITYGLTLFYINFHVFGRMVFGEKIFGKLGSEWLPKQLKAVGGKNAATVESAFGIVEVMLLIFLDLIFMALILGALSIIVMIASWMGDTWWGKAVSAWQLLWGVGWGGLQALVDLFV